MSAIAGSGPMLICAAAPDAPINTTLAATGIPILIALEFAILFPFFTVKRCWVYVVTKYLDYEK